MAAIDPSKRKQWVRVLPDLQGKFTTGKEGDTRRCPSVKSTHTPDVDSAYQEFQRSRPLTTADFPTTPTTSRPSKAPADGRRFRARLGGVSDEADIYNELGEVPPYPSPRVPQGDFSPFPFPKTGSDPKGGAWAFNDSQISQSDLNDAFSGIRGAQRRSVAGRDPTASEVMNYDFGTEKVRALSIFDFEEFLKSKQKVLVIFYKPDDYKGFSCREEFSRAAMARQPARHRYAAVDCTMDKELCCQEQASPLPMMKLYSNGFLVSTIKDVRDFNAHQMKMLVTMTPVLYQSRFEMGKAMTGS